MKHAKAILNTFLIANLVSFPISILFGCGVGKLYGVWAGIGAGIFASLLFVAGLGGLWFIAARFRK
jgi:hypothetical protein